MGESRTWLREVTPIGVPVKCRMFVLVQSGNDPIRKVRAKRSVSDIEMARLTRLMECICQVGFAEASRHQYVKKTGPVDAEIRIGGSVARAFCYMGGHPKTMVVVSIEKAHQGTDQVFRFNRIVDSHRQEIERLLLEKGIGHEQN
jgi:hypothetical protein